MADQVPIEDLDPAGRARFFVGREVTNSLKAAGFSDEPAGFSPRLPVKLTRIAVQVTASLGTTAATYQLGTAASAGAYGSVTIPVTAVKGDIVVGTIVGEGEIPANTNVVGDQAASTGNGAYVPLLDYEFQSS